MNRMIALFGAVAMLAGCNQDVRSTHAGDTSVKTTPVSFNVAGAPVVEINAPDMMCPEGCGVKVKEILSEQPGAKEVFVDFDAKTARVAIEGDGKFDVNAAVAALADHGFKNSSLKSDARVKSPATNAPAVQ